jgi:hypothetical protein
MMDAGYFARRIAVAPDWLKAPHVREICSVSECISAGPPGWIDRWQHNAFGWYNRMQDARQAVPAARAHEYRLFAYRLHPEIFRQGRRMPLSVPADIRPEPIPGAFRSLGFDAASKSSESGIGLECSPLSCNGMARECPANELCLFPTIEAAMAGADRFSREQPEPGDY